MSTSFFLKTNMNELVSFEALPILHSRIKELLSWWRKKTFDEAPTPNTMHSAHLRIVPCVGKRRTRLETRHDASLFLRVGNMQTWVVQICKQKGGRHSSAYKRMMHENVTAGQRESAEHEREWLIHTGTSSTYCSGWCRDCARDEKAHLTHFKHKSKSALICATYEGCHNNRFLRRGYRGQR